MLKQSAKVSEDYAEAKDERKTAGPCLTLVYLSLIYSNPATPLLPWLPA